MSVKSKLTTISDEIRYRTGLGDLLSLDQMAIDIAGLPAGLGTVPEYVRTEAQRVAAIVAGLQNSYTFSFICLSDTHVRGNSTYDNSVLHACQAAKLISDQVPIDFIAHLGDHVYGSKSEDAAQQQTNHRNALRLEAVADPTLRLAGNHDPNINNADAFMDAQTVYRYVGRKNTAAAQPDTDAYRGYCHYDLESKHLRVICLNTADIPDASVDHYISPRQLAWLVDTLDMSQKEGWSIVVLSHHPIHWQGTYMGNVLAVLDAYVSGGSGSVTADGETVSYDFAGKNGAALIGNFHGHTHNLISGTAGQSEIPRLATPNACADRNNEYGNAETYAEWFTALYGEKTTYEKTLASAADTAFCVYTVDTAAGIIYATCYGAGYDRAVSYATSGPIYHLVKNELTNVTSDNTTALVEAGSTYAATLTPAAGGLQDYMKVTVTMGGEDVTDLYYEDGMLYIEQVTGDIVITASTIVNVLRLATTEYGGSEIYNGVGYASGTRMNSSGDISSALNMCLTGYIPFIKGQTMRIRGMTIAGGATPYYFTYGASNPTVPSAYFNLSTNTPETDENGDFVMTVDTSSCVALRFSVGIIDENTIFTIDQEIA